MKPNTDPYCEYQLLQKIKELQNDYNALKWEFDVFKMKKEKEIKDKDKQINNLKQNISYYHTSIQFIASCRKIIKRQTCRYADRLDFADAELILPYIKFPHTYTMTPYLEIFYMWLKGYTYREIGILVNKSTERIRQIIVKVARLYRKQKDDILEGIKINKQTSLITNDYRNNREEMINQIKGVYNG